MSWNIENFHLRHAPTKLVLWCRVDPGSPQAGQPFVSHFMRKLAFAKIKSTSGLEGILKISEQLSVFPPHDVRVWFCAKSTDCKICCNLGNERINAGGIT